jgi:four helix bundle protein
MRDHKSLLCWQLARDFSGLIQRVTVQRWTPPAGVAFDQLRRAALSIRLNIAEGYARGTAPQFAHFLTIAYGSAVECAELLDYCAENDLLRATETESLSALDYRIQALVIRLKHRCFRSLTRQPLP